MGTVANGSVSPKKSELIRKEKIGMSKTRFLFVLALLVSAVLAGCSNETHQVTGPEGFNEGGALLGKKPPPPTANPAIAVVTPYHAAGNRIYVMNVDGSNLTEVYYSNRLRDPSWSPDGKHIAFMDATDDFSEVWRIDIEVVNGKPVGNNAYRLIDRVQGVPEWSPLGDVILITRYPDEGGYARKIEVIPATGGDPSLLYEVSSGTVWCPVWSPGGDRVAFVWSHDGLYELGVLDVATGAANFVPFPAFPRFMDWSRTREDDEVAFEADGKLYTIDTDEPGRITYLFDGACPTWSPEAPDRLIFNHARGYLAMHNFETGETTKVYKWGWFPDWSRYVAP